MPKPKYDPWDKAKTNRIKAKRVEVGLGSPAAFSRALKERGVELSDQAYMRRETGVTPVLVNEIQGIADVLGLPLEEVVELYSRPINDACHS